MTDTILRRLRFDNDTRKAVMELIYYHDVTFEVGEKHVKRWLNKIGQKQFERLLKLRRADIMGQNSKYIKEWLCKIDKIDEILHNVLNNNECFSIKMLALNGEDILKILNIKPGKQVGVILNSVLDAIIDGKLANNKNEIEKWVVSNFNGE